MVSESPRKDGELQIPIFTDLERFNIGQEISPYRWKEINNGVPIKVNAEWELHIIRDGLHGFPYFETSRDDILEFLLMTGEVAVWTGKGDQYEGCGFKLIPRDKNRENPFDGVMSELNTEFQKKMQELDTGIKSISGEIRRIIEERNILQKEEDSLKEKLNVIKRLRWDIPKSILSGKTPNELLDELLNL